VNGWCERKDITAYCQPVLVRALVLLSHREGCVAVLQTDGSTVEVGGKEKKRKHACDG